MKDQSDGGHDVGGIRAAEHYAPSPARSSSSTSASRCPFSLFTDFENLSLFKPTAHHDAAATRLFEEIESWSTAMKTLRG